MIFKHLADEFSQCTEILLDTMLNININQI